MLYNFYSKFDYFLRLVFPWTLVRGNDQVITFLAGPKGEIRRDMAANSRIRIARTDAFRVFADEFCIALFNFCFPQVSGRWQTFEGDFETLSLTHAGTVKFFCQFFQCIKTFHTNGRNGGIRTRGPLLPKQVLYQAELHSDLCRNVFRIRSVDLYMIFLMKQFQDEDY